MKMLNLALVSVAAGSFLFAEAGNKMQQAGENMAKTATLSFDQIEKEIVDKRKMGLFPVNTNEKKEIQKFDDKKYNERLNSKWPPSTNACFHNLIS